MLTPFQVAQVDATLAELDRLAREAEQLAEEHGGSWWAWLIGADSAAAALRTNARASRRLYETMREKAERWAHQAEPVSAAELATFLESRSAASNDAARETAQQLTAREAARQTIGGDPRDPRDWFPKLPRWLWVALGLVALAAVVPLLTTIAAFGGARRR